MAGSKKKFTVNDHQGKTFTIEADRVEANPGSASVTFYVGDEIVASFRGYTSYYHYDATS